MTQQPQETKVIQPHMVAQIAAVDQLEYRHPPEEIIHHFTTEATKLEVQLVKFRPYGAPCNSIYKAAHNSGLRPLSVIAVSVIHCTQSSGRALGVARYFTEQSSGGSTQFVSDDNECYRCLSDQQIPWGAPGANYIANHYEQVGFVSWSKFMWSKTHRATISRTAWKVARDLKRYGNSPRWLNESQLRAVRADVLAGRPTKGGVTDHATATKAFGGDHTDPGPNYPRALFMSLVKSFYLVIKVRRLA